MTEKAFKLNRLNYLILAGLITVGFLLYLAGFKLLLVLSMLGVGACLLPVPALLSSWLGRIVASLVFNLCLLQLAAILQFLFLPESGLVVISAIYAVLGLFALAVAYSKNVQPAFGAKVFSKHGIAAVIAAAVFIIPFLAIIFGSDSLLSIVKLGGLQAPDAEHHFDFINSTTSAGHLDRSGYPKDLHLGLGFIQDSVIANQSELSWTANIFVFFGYYLAFGVLSAYIMYFVCQSLLSILSKKSFVPNLALNIAISLGLAVPLCVLVLWPFIGYGFLNYYFTLVALGLGLICFIQNKRELGVIMFFGAAASWPLVAPALIATLLLWLPWSNDKGWRGKITSVKTYAMLFSTSLVALPAVLQVVLPALHGDLNASGGLQSLNVVLLCAGMLIVAWLVLGRMGDAIKRVALNVYFPLFVLCVALVLMHFYALGHPSYYSIKIAILLETFLLVLGTAVLFAKYLTTTDYTKRLFILPFLPILVILLLLAPNSNPLRGVRDLFRDQANVSKPMYYDQDAFNIARLGSQNKINNFNVALLHYNPSDGKITGHALLAQWAQFMKYERDDASQASKLCHRQVYRILVDGSGTKLEQTQLAEEVRRCARLAVQNNQQYYIITDNGSVDHLKSVFGEGVVIYVSS